MALWEVSGEVSSLHRSDRRPPFAVKPTSDNLQLTKRWSKWWIFIIQNFCHLDRKHRKGGRGGAVGLIVSGWVRPAGNLGAAQRSSCGVSCPRDPDYLTQHGRTRRPAFCDSLKFMRNIFLVVVTLERTNVYLTLMEKYVTHNYVQFAKCSIFWHQWYFVLSVMKWTFIMDEPEWLD